MFRKLFLGALIVLYFSNVNAMQEESESHTLTVINSAEQIINKYNAVNNPLSAVNNQQLFDDYNNTKCIIPSDLLFPKSCTTLYDVLLLFAIAMRVGNLLQNDEFAKHNDAIELIDFSTVGVNNHIRKLINEFCDINQEDIEEYDIYFKNNKLLIRHV